MNNQKYSYHRHRTIGQDESFLIAQLENYITDATFRKDIELSLKELADLKFALNESTIIAVTDSKGRIQYVNERFCEISKYSREELLGKDHRLINSGYHEKAFMEELWSTISSGKVWRGEIKNKAKDGSFYWVNTTIVPFLNDAGQPYQYLAIRNEVTELKRVEEELKQMMNKVIHIQEEERKRFSRELHDGIGQSLFSLLIQIDQLISNGEQSKQQLKRLREDVSLIIEDIRSMAWELRPSVLDDLGVVPAIRRYIEKYSQHYGIHVSFESNLTHRLDIHIETTIYRIIQEALKNIGKYAKTSEAWVSIRDNENEIGVEIEDKGIGFNEVEYHHGVGLFSMEERARSIGGSLLIRSTQSEGTIIKLTIPK